MDTEFYAIMYQALGTTAGAAIGYLVGLALFIVFAYKFIKDLSKSCYKLSRKLKRLYRIKKLAKK